MTDETQVEKTKIVIPTAEYTKCKTAAGGASHHNGDAIATALVGALLSDVYKIAALMLTTEEAPVEVADLEAKYEHLNAGQQRMNLGNRIRGAVNKIDNVVLVVEKKNVKIAEANKLIEVFNTEVEALNADLKEGEKAKNPKPLKDLLELPVIEQTGAQRLAEVAAPIREGIDLRLAAEAEAKAEKDAAAAEAKEAAAKKKEKDAAAAEAKEAAAKKKEKDAAKKKEEAKTSKDDASEQSDDSQSEE